jgi:hypothetical protein
MATTTNYSWTTPDDTALVKDGAAAIRSLGTAIDSTVFTNAGNAINKTIVDAKGDIIAATAADTVDRLAVGANDTVLTADSSTATGLKWAAPAAGGMTLISTTTFNGTPTTVLSSIPATYNDLRIVIRLPLPATDNQTLSLRINNDSNANRHQLMTSDNASNNGNSIPFDQTRVTIAGGLDNAVTNSLCIVDIPDYTNSTTWKLFRYTSIGTDATTSTQFTLRNGTGFYNQTSAISSLGFMFNSGNATSGTILLYGVK